MVSKGIKIHKDMTTAIATLNSNEAHRAMVIANRTNNVFLAGLMTARIADLKRRMQTGVVGFTFLKADGKTITHRYGTTMPGLAKSHINGRGLSGEYRNVVVFWDTEAEGENKWRSFRVERLINIDN